MSHENETDTKRCSEGLASISTVFYLSEVSSILFANTVIVLAGSFACKTLAAMGA
jgi:hypothetical protein